MALLQKPRGMLRLNAAIGLAMINAQLLLITYTPRATAINDKVGFFRIMNNPTPITR